MQPQCQRYAEFGVFFSAIKFPSIFSPPLDLKERNQEQLSLRPRKRGRRGGGKEKLTQSNGWGSRNHPPSPLPRSSLFHYIRFHLPLPTAKRNFFFLSDSFSLSFLPALQYYSPGGGPPRAEAANRPRKSEARKYGDGEETWKPSKTRTDYVRRPAAAIYIRF